jgi:DNA-binding IclR family transcriptional regulator
MLDRIEQDASPAGRAVTEGGRAGMRGAALRAAVLAAEPGPKDLLTTVERALEALEAMADSPMPVPAKAVAQRLGISLGTSYRVLHTLEHAGYVVRLGHGCFGFSGKAASLTRQFQDGLDVVGTFRPALKRLAEEAEEDAYLAILRGGEIAVAEVIEGSKDLHVEGLEVGFTGVAHTSAIGKVLMAACPDDTIDDYLGQRDLRALTARTLVQRRHIKSDLNAVRETGVGHDLEELAVGCCCVAAPVRDARGAVVGSIGLSAPTARWRREEARLTRLCVSAAVLASKSLLRGPPLPA